MTDPILVTAALPYANGSIHLGHLLEYTLGDIYVRALRLAGEHAIYICADDTHGTPIELSALKAGVAPDVFVAKCFEEHVADLKSFGIKFDSFYSTNSIESRSWVNFVYGKLKEGNYVEKRPLEQLYDEKAGRFLPDRFVRGTCPKCDAVDQYGDVCEVCGSTYAPTDLKQPYSAISGTRPVLRTSEHLFVGLTRFIPMLRAWAETPGRLQPEIRNFVESWISGGLRDWCISRDAPYFGFPIPGEKDKFFYVWLDAPLGYISSTENWAKSEGHREYVDQIWKSGTGRIEHIIGKDIIYFHTLFWPAMLTAAGLTVPRKIHVHGMLTFDGVKMSKSRGTFINGAMFRKHLDPVYLRYFFSSKIGPQPEDVDLSIEEFVNRVNSELVNNIVNLVSRGVPFIKDKLGGRYGNLRPEASHHIEVVKQKVSDAEKCYRAFDLAGATRIAVELATLGNKLFQEGAPWKLIKENEEAARDLVTLCLNIARAALVIIAPAVPTLVEKIYPMLGLAGAPASFREGTAFDLTDRPIGTPGRIIERIERKQLEDMVEESKPEDVRNRKADISSIAAPPVPKKPSKAEASPAEITIEDFNRVDLRVGLVLAATVVEGSDKLLKLTVDVGGEKPRTIFAGIRQAYAPEAIVGKKLAVVVNLAPRKMSVGISEGMALAGGPGGKDVWLCELPTEAVPGSRIH